MVCTRSHTTLSLPPPLPPQVLLLVHQPWCQLLSFQLESWEDLHIAQVHSGMQVIICPTKESASVVSLPSQSILCTSWENPCYGTRTLPEVQSINNCERIWLTIFNPGRRACAARVTVLALCVCVCVCACVRTCVRAFAIPLPQQPLISTP